MINLLTPLLRGLPNIDVTKISRLGSKTATDVDEMILNATEHAPLDPDYDKLAARLLLSKIKPISSLHDSLIHGVTIGLVNPDLLIDFDLEYLNDRLVTSRDFGLSFMSAKILYDRYLLHDRGIRFETPQIMFMRVAMGITQGESKEITAQVYDAISKFDFLPSTPILFNSGLRRQQLASCFVSTIGDSLESIMGNLTINATLQKWAGGIGNDWSNVRGRNAWINGTNGPSQGTIPFMRVYNAVLEAVNQGSKRRGSGCAYMEPWHIDIFEFLELRKPVGDERMRTHSMNTALWIPDLFMERVRLESKWSLFSPEEVPELHDLYGEAFDSAYKDYEKRGEQGELRSFAQVDALTLWRKILTMVFETGHPWLTFKDAFNLRNPQSHAGVIHSSNLCTEIGLNTSEHEIGVCNLASVNLANHIGEDGCIDYPKLGATLQLMTRILDNVIDLNFYPVKEAESAKKHRPIGIGVMGYQDLLYRLEVPWESEEATVLGDRLMEFISHSVISASSDLARERGSYESYHGSSWYKGELPIDSLAYLNHRSRSIDTSHTMDWSTVREKITKYGMRNSNCLAIAPTATIANIAGVSQSIEPTYQNIFVKSNLSGEFLWINPYLVKALQRAGLWHESLIDELKRSEGSLQHIESIPQSLKDLFKTAFEIDQRWIIESASRRQKWIDQSQSLNLYFASPTGALLSEVYFQAWSQGLKSTYYLRSKSKTSMCVLPTCEVCQ